MINSNRYYDKHKRDDKSKAFYNSTAWKKKRAEIIARDNGECQSCKAKGKVTIDNPNIKSESGRKKVQIVVHHIQELKDYPELSLTDSNLVTWCWDCHEEHHGRSSGRYFHNPNRFAEDERWD